MGRRPIAHATDRRPIKSTFVDLMGRRRPVRSTHFFDFVDLMTTFVDLMVR